MAMIIFITMTLTTTMPPPPGLDTFIFQDPLPTNITNNIRPFSVPRFSSLCPSPGLTLLDFRTPPNKHNKQHTPVLCPPVLVPLSLPRLGHFYISGPAPNKHQVFPRANCRIQVCLFAFKLRFLSQPASINRMLNEDLKAICLHC
jgi:hypothetical protein